MRRISRVFSLLFAVILILSSCSQIPDEPALSVSATEEITTAKETLTSPPPETDTEEVTDDSTEEVTEETTDEVTEEVTTEKAGLEILSADEILFLTELRAEAYHSYTRLSRTSIEIDILGSKSSSESGSELRVAQGNASFLRESKDGSEYIYLVGDELYYESDSLKYRIGGYDRAAFLSLVSDLSLMNSFLNGNVTEDGDEFRLTFSGIDDGGRAEIIAMLGLPEGYSVSFGKASLDAVTDDKANLLSSNMSVALSVSYGGERLMEVLIISSTEQKDFGEDIVIDLPDPDSYIYFTDNAALSLYGSLAADIQSFSSSYSKFEYSVRDDMLISSDAFSIPLTSKTVYAYNSRIGASIDKAFDNGDGTGMHTTLTHFNNRRGFSQIDGGSIFVDTTVNAGNLAFTLAYPFSTSFFALDHCMGMDAELSDSSTLVFTLNEKAVKNIASNLLLRAGILSSPELSDTRAYTYIKLDSEGNISSIGYEFSSQATVSGTVFTLSRSVELEIVSINDANVKVIYIEVEDEE